MRFDLTDLRLFLSIVECGTVTGGANAMHLALASASERLVGMESALGTALLERHRRGVRPTAAGEALVRHARSILGQVEQMRGELRTYATGLKGRIRLLTNTAANATFLPPQLCQFLAAHPDLSIDLDERPSTEIVQLLMDRRADLGIAADTADLSTLQAFLITSDSLVVVASRAHRLARAPSVAYTDVLNEPVVGMADRALEAHLAERAARVGRQLDYRIQLRSAEQAVHFIEAGIGVAIVSAGVAAGLRGELAIVPLAEPWATRRLYLCARDFTSLTPHAALLAQHLLPYGPADA